MFNSTCFGTARDRTSEQMENTEKTCIGNGISLFV